MYGEMRGTVTLPVLRLAVRLVPLLSWRKAFLAVSLLLGAAALAFTTAQVSESPSQSAIPSGGQIILQLTRYGARPEGNNPDLDVLFATPQYFAQMRQAYPAPAGAAASYFFFVTENTHIDDLPASPPRPRLRINGGPWQEPAQVTVVADSPHHRSTRVRYERAGQSAASADFTAGAASFDLLFPAADGTVSSSNLLTWEAGATSLGMEDRKGFKVTWVTGLGLLGGFLAAMWPCLFQLTVFFIPGMAGISMSEARKTTHAPAIHGQVLRTAIFFVLGIVVVYTAAGAAAGFAAQSLTGTSIFETWRRPLTMVAGLFILFMAVRVAVRARAPLVCKMPILSGLGSRGPTGPVATMLAGLAFATGCMTCFGAALALGMLTYILSSASWWSGALLMFIFSLGISIPLVAASLAMARVLPLLGKLERITPWMAVASSGVMVAFAVLLISDNYHIVSNVAYQTVKSFGG